MNELADSFRWRLPVKCKMGSVFVVFGFPSLQLSSKIPFMFEMPSLVELLGIGFMASFDLPVHLRAAWWYVLVRDAQVRKMPSELGPERRTIVSLNFLNREGKMLPDFLKKVDGGLGVVVVVDSQHAKSSRFVDTQADCSSISTTDVTLACGKRLCNSLALLSFILLGASLDVRP
jgi:hypothetical protein